MLAKAPYKYATGNEGAYITQPFASLTAGQLGRQGHRVGDVGEVRERAVRDDVDAAGGRRRARDEPGRARGAEWAKTASKRAQEPCAARRLCPGRGSRGRTSCAVSTSGPGRVGRSGASTCGRGQPLDVDDVGVLGPPAR